MVYNKNIRSFEYKDIEQITKIYNYYIKNSSVTFDWDPLTDAEMQYRIEKILHNQLPYLVLEEKGKILGYAYAGPFRERKAWKWAVEDSIYLHPDCSRKGYGKKLLAALIEECEKKDIRIMVAAISSKGNLASLKLHQKMGFRIIGTMLDIGYKMDSWQDIVLMQKRIGKGDTTAPKDI